MQRVTLFYLIALLFTSFSLSLALPSSAQSSDEFIRAEVRNLADESRSIRKAAVMALAKTGDMRVEAILESFKLGELYLWSDVVVLCKETFEDDDYNEFCRLVDVLTGEPMLDAGGKRYEIPIEELEEISVSRAERKLANNAKFLVRLSSPDNEIRMSGAKKCGDPPGIIESVPQLEQMSAHDSVKKIRYIAKESLLLIRLNQTSLEKDAEPHLAIVSELGNMKSMRGLPRLQETYHELSAGLALPEATEEEATNTYKFAIDQINGYQSFVGGIGNIFRGLSLGSVLILMALGLAITFGLMGVINMAHGELMMIGAYATFEMQRVFGHTPDNPSDLYYVAALPVAFLTAAFVGYLIEISVVRHLYRRPLESLLATWGIGLILIQVVRIRYGDNIGVNAPTWARGGLEVMQDLIVPYSRCFIIVLCGLCVLLIYYLMNHTKLGLRMRATMQNRNMANSVGVNTQRVDRYTFAFGSGIAGVAGYAWTLIGGVTPDMGQTNFIIDSFLVVVTGGVGELIGVICAGLGIGVLTKVIEPMTIGPFVVGAIWAKILLLLIIVGFIQFKPAGLFSPKGRLSDV
ncbi:MAG: urea ABC transporter permease subunit UrtB [Candidatus Poribacteria bacterium]|nr:urea ABC transporter permease subunit UrtB [Candidatus Poribacteria bacterium]MDE0502855.1 urea ABC transporter permease subunit UrtB [Candidatus Poribacteria bacterium]